MTELSTVRAELLLILVTGSRAGGAQDDQAGAEGSG